MHAWMALVDAHLMRVPALPFKGRCTLTTRVYKIWELLLFPFCFYYRSKLLSL